MKGDVKGEWREETDVTLPRIDSWHQEITVGRGNVSCWIVIAIEADLTNTWEGKGTNDNTHYQWTKVLQIVFKNKQLTKLG